MNPNSAPRGDLFPVDGDKVEYLDLPRQIPESDVSAERFYKFLDQSAKIAAKSGRTDFIILVNPETVGVIASYLNTIGERQGGGHVIHNWKHHKEIRVTLEKEDVELARGFREAMRQPLEPEVAEALTQALTSLRRKI